MVKTLPVDGFEDYVNLVNEILANWEYESGYVWYRGVSRRSYRLIPRILRNPDLPDEDTLVQEFIINYQAIHGERVDDAWEMYALMQHYGLPTRLLDWTKSPLIALYFALEEEDPWAVDRVVWVMDPSEFNQITHNESGVIVPKDLPHIAQRILHFSTYLPVSMRLGTASSPVPDKPLAIEPPLSNRRILYQQGCFTVHGCKSESIDTYFRRAYSDRIIRLVVKGRRRRGAFLDTLHNLGFKEEYVYQDLPSLTRRVVRESEGK